VPQTLTREPTPVGRAVWRPIDIGRRERPGGRAGAASARPLRSPRLWARRVWFAVTIAVNAPLIALAAWTGGLVAHATEASLATFCIALAARHDGIVRGAFVLGRRVRSYRLHQLTYHLGQLHRAMAIAGTLWFAVAVAGAATSGDAVGRTTGIAVLALLLAMIWTARDARRHGRHDRFEAIHRYGGWAAVAILVALVLRQALHASPDGIAALLAQPSVLLLIALVALVIHPWVGVRRVAVEVLRVTDQVVVVALPGRRSVGAFVRVSREGKEWHCFAVATTAGEGDKRYCLVIRRAGDWTEKLARDAERGRQPTHLLVRRMRGCGFMYHAQTHGRPLVVATGAGIGPVLPYLLGVAPARVECLWIARDHRAAVGEDLVTRILAGGNVTLLDTSAGRPDVGARVAALATGFDAVFVVSNERVRDEVAAVCEDLGVPWYGPTFDS
jgi:succinate dehydrogenase hydrophobic anchor subunit